MNPEQQIQRLETNALRLLRDVEQLPADVLYREPGPGEWPVMSTLAHVAELLPFWAHQAEGIAREPGSSFGRSHDDPRRVGPIEQHGHDALDAIVPSIRLGLDQCLATLRSIPAEAWSKTGQHATRGEMSVADIVDRFLVSHVEEHQAQIASTLSTVSASTRH